MNTLNQL